MSCGDIHVSDENVTFTFTIMENCVAISVASVTLKTLTFTKPSGSTLTKTASFSTDGTDGNIYYASIAGDLDEAGIWNVQAKVQFGSGSSYHSETKKFKVLPNL
jgi:hypothetical protein